MIEYKTKEDLHEHQLECKNLLVPNICLFNIYDGKTCKKVFKETASLIIHYYIEHQQYACATCYATFDSVQKLEEHAHSDELNLRLSE